MSYYKITVLMDKVYRRYLLSVFDQIYFKHNSEG